MDKIEQNGTKVSTKTADTNRNKQVLGTLFEI